MMSFPFNVYFAALLGSALTTGLTLPLWRKWCERTGLVDDPGDRKIHTTPTPLAGGLAVISGMMLPVLAGSLLVLWHFGPDKISLTLDRLQYGVTHRAGQLIAILAGALGMLLIGLRDDKVELRPAIKFTGQLIIALAVATSGVRITLFVPSLVFSYVITILWLLTVTNAFNFMDNMNGLCAGLGVDQFMAPHGLCVDSRGDIYVGEVSWTQWPQLFPKDPMPTNLRSLRKFRKVG